MAIYRWHDGALSVLWLYNRNGDKSLLELARKLRAQGHDWKPNSPASGSSRR